MSRQSTDIRLLVHAYCRRMLRLTVCVRAQDIQVAGPMGIGLKKSEPKLGARANRDWLIRTFSLLAPKCRARSGGLSLRLRGGLDPAFTTRREDAKNRQVVARLSIWVCKSAGAPAEVVKDLARRVVARRSHHSPAGMRPGPAEIEIP